MEKDQCGYGVSRRDILRTMAASAVALGASRYAGCGSTLHTGKRPNILLAIADDWSWPHAGILSPGLVKTPTFDRTAREGVLFQNAFVSSPSCTPSRAALLTGRHHWQLEDGANLWGTLPAKYDVYPDLLESEGYHTGFVRKGWGPGRVKPGGRERNPAGKRFVSTLQFFKNCPSNTPFCFWFGSRDPHRPYSWRTMVDHGKKIRDVKLPSILPDALPVRDDFCNYLFEVERFDREVGRILAKLERDNELDNTIVIMTSDNGMPFPRCKANCYDDGVRVPLAIRWGDKIKPGRVVNDFVSLCDLAPTLMEAAQCEIPQAMAGKSLMPILLSAESGKVDPMRTYAITGRERHTLGQPGGRGGYPVRAIRTEHYLYIKNYEPDRWPAGAPRGYSDIDRSPTKRYILANKNDPAIERFYKLACEKRGPEELYDLASDLDQVKNVAGNPAYADIKHELAATLEDELRRTRDPRVFGRGDVFDQYRYFVPKRVHM